MFDTRRRGDPSQLLPPPASHMHEKTAIFTPDIRREEQLSS